MNEPSFGPDLYRRNGFRVTDLPVDATARTIRRRRRETTLDVTSAPRNPMPLEPPPTPTELNAAFARIEDPRTRIVDELTWVWKQPDGYPPARMTKGTLTAHDRTVLAHCRALDLEQRGSGLTAAQQRERDEAWATAMRGWRAVSADKSTWAHLHRRRVELDDARLSERDVDALHDGIVDALLAASAELAVAGTEGDAVRHRGFMTELAGGAAVDRAIRAAAGDLVRQVDDATAEARAGAPDDQATARRLIERTSAPMATLRSALPVTDPLLRRLGDAVAVVIQQVAVTTVNQAQFGRRPDLTRVASVAHASVQLLSTAAELAVGRDERTSIKEDLATCVEVERTAVQLGGQVRTDLPSRPGTRSAGDRTQPVRPDVSRRQAVWAVLGGLLAAATALTGTWGAWTFLGVAGPVGFFVLIAAGGSAAVFSFTPVRWHVLRWIAVALVLVLTLDPYPVLGAIAALLLAGLAGSPATKLPPASCWLSFWLAAIAGLLVSTLWLGSTWAAAASVAVVLPGEVGLAVGTRAYASAGARCTVVGLLAVAAWIWWGGGLPFLLAGLLVLVVGGLVASGHAITPTVPRALVVAALGVVGIVAGILLGAWWLWVPAGVVALMAVSTALAPPTEPMSRGRT